MYLTLIGTCITMPYRHWCILVNLLIIFSLFYFSIIFLLRVGNLYTSKKFFNNQALSLISFEHQSNTPSILYNSYGNNLIYQSILTLALG